MISLPRPWLDRKKRFSSMRAFTLVVLVAPGAWDAFAYWTGRLGPRPVHELLHQAGLWAIWFLAASLAISPAKAVLGLPQIVVLRRMIGLTALWYSLAHVVLYAADEQWRLVHVVSEIVLRFYLTIGFFGVLILGVLGWTSRDSAQRKWGGAAWKRLHRTVYLVVALAVLHYFLQLKADVSQAVVVGGVFIWLMLWRALPVGRDRGAWAVAFLAVATTAATVLLEYGWYALFTKVDPERVVSGELDVAFGLQPADQVLALSVLAGCAIELRRISLTRHARTMWASMLVYAGGATLAGLGVIAVGWSDLTIDDPVLWARSAVWIAAVALMGMARHFVRDLPAHRWLDLLWAVCLAYPAFTSWFDGRSFALFANGLVIGATLLLAARVWSMSRASALLLAPLVAWVGYSAANLW